MKGKIIVIEGTDCSGKKTQTDLLVKRLNEEGKKVASLSFPMYDTPTGKIVGGPFLGKSAISDCYFPEGSASVNGLVGALYYAADRLYNLDKLTNLLNEGYTVIFDRYVTSNLGHQAGKLKIKEERENAYHVIETLEYDLLKLPKPDIVIFLFMPVEFEIKLRENRSTSEPLDSAEKDSLHQVDSSNSYLELVKRNGFLKVDCVKENQIRPINDINDEIYQIVNDFLKEES